MKIFGQTLLGGMIFLSLMATGCSKDDVVEPGNEVMQGKTITLNATINNGAETRLTYNDDPANRTMTVDWSAKEEFNLYLGTNGTPSLFKKEVAGGSFTGKLPDNKDGNTFYAVYGSDITNSDGVLSVDISSQTGTRAENGIKEFMLAEPGSQISSNTTLTFNHMLAVLKLTFSLPAVVDKLDKITVSGMHNKCTYKLGASSPYTFVAEKEVDGNKVDENIGNIVATNGEEGFPIKDGKFTAYIGVFPEKVAGDQVTITATMGDVSYSYTMPTEYTFQAGKVTPANVSFSSVKMSWTSGTTAENIKKYLGEAGEGEKDFVISSSELSVADFAQLKTALKDYKEGSINLTLLDQKALPDGITTGVLQECNALLSFTAPNLTTVGKYAMKGCINLKMVSLPNVQSVGTDGFYVCTSLESIELPQATSLYSSAFDNCISLTSVSLPKVETVGSSAFNCCEKLTKIELPQATSLDDYVFAECKNLTSVYLPKAAGVPEHAFYAESAEDDNCDRSQISITVMNGSGSKWWWKEVLPKVDNAPNYGWKEVKFVNFNCAYTMEDYYYWDAYSYIYQGSNEFKEGNYGAHIGDGVTAEQSCKSCPTASQMVAYLNAGVYWDDNTSVTDGQQTYTVYYRLNVSEPLHKGLWVKKKSLIENFDSSGDFSDEEYSVTPTKLSTKSEDEVKRIRTGGEYFFLPAASYYKYDASNPIYSGAISGGSSGVYWLSTPYSGDVMVKARLSTRGSTKETYAYFLKFDENVATVLTQHREVGYIPMIAE